MTYAISDIHGDYAKYIRLLQTIDLRPGDTLYILGDVVDRGPEPMKVLRDMMSRSNVVPILGNHEFTMAYCLRFLLKEITDDTIAELDDVQWAALQEMTGNGREYMMKAITFGDIRNYCPRIDKVFICRRKP